MRLFGKPKAPKVLLEEEAFTMLMNLLTLAKGGHPYRHLLPALKDGAARYPRVAALVRSVAENLEAGLTPRRR